MNTLLKEYDLEKLSSELFNASRDGNPEKIESLIKAGANPNWISSIGSTALHQAVINQKFTAVKILLKAGVNPNHQDQYGRTPLHMAAHYDFFIIARELIRMGAKPEICSKEDNNNALHWACVRGSTRVAKLICESFEDINQPNCFGYTALHCAAHNGSFDIVKILVDKGADIDLKTHLEMLPDQLAHQSNYSDITTYLQTVRQKNMLSELSEENENSEDVNDEEVHRQRFNSI